MQELITHLEMLKNMKEIIKKYGYAMYLGGALALLNKGFNTWEYWAIMIPVILLVKFNQNK